MSHLVVYQDMYIIYMCIFVCTPVVRWHSLICQLHVVCVCVCVCVCACVCARACVRACVRV